MTLDKKCRLLSLLLPHLRWKVWLRVDNLVFSRVDVKTSLLHLVTEFSHHNCGLSLILICLHYAFILVRMIICALIRLSESMMIRLASQIVPKTTKVSFRFHYFIDFYSYYLNLIISQTYFNFKSGWHDEFICINWVKVMLPFFMLLDLTRLLLLHLLYILRQLLHWLFKFFLLLHLLLLHLLLIKLFLGHLLLIRNILVRLLELISRRLLRQFVLRLLCWIRGLSFCTVVHFILKFIL